MNPRISDLPSTIYLLPVDGFLLLPEASLPLTLTSPLRRRILEAAEDEGGWVGVIQGQSEARDFEVGCLAHITSLGRTEAGHHLVLEGRIRFRVREDLRDAKGLPRASVSYAEFARDLECIEEEVTGFDLDAFKEQLVSFGRDRFGTAGILEDMTPREVVRFMAQTSPFDPAERQALLEARDFREMMSVLMQLLAINFLTTTPDTSPRAH
ncbi:MAG TPA: LON peptidase substrate-binding domain-containing protein [Thermoanaerobaculia bacterium]|jgi:hypothetical protein|nr:LON peptidase substrate-binding domain-containing protein [Thermoanaerobaculia bacterium]